MNNAANVGETLGWLVASCKLEHVPPVKIAAASGTDIRESPINGKGLFATRPAAPGDVLVSNYMRKQTTDDPRTRWEQSESCRYTNHANSANAFVRKIGDHTDLIADEQIQPNEEITVNYKDATRTLGNGFFYTYQGKPYGEGPEAIEFARKMHGTKAATFYGLPTFLTRTKTGEELVMVIVKQAQTTDDIEDRLENARANTATDVSDGIAAAGNYRKGRFNYHGLRISIENPKGSTRSGTGEDGKRWSRQLKYDYGYIRGTMGADGDPLDVFIGDNPKSEMVYVLNQNQKNGDFDEHKVILGVLDAKQAKQTYLANYEAGWSRTGKIVPMTIQQFKDWATSDATEKPVGEVKQAAAPTEAAAKLRALLIEGNPDRPGNPERMHTALSNMLRDRGYAVQRVSSADYSDVPDSDVAIGFSRGGGRLRFSNAPVRIGVGTQAYDGVSSVNHPRDNVDLTRPDDFNALSVATQRAHSTLTPGMRKQIEALLQPQLVKQAEAPALPEIPKLPNLTVLPWRDRVEVFARKPHTGEIYGGRWDADKSFAVPGGGIDPGEDAPMAAVREYMEETGIPITNARVAPVKPVEHNWTDELRQRSGKNLAGTRTHFVEADIAGEPSTDKLDHWGAGERGYYSPEAALKMMLANKNYVAKVTADQRIALLKHMLANAAGSVKQADITTTLQPHQQRVVDKIQRDDQPGLVVAHGVGSGKSLASLAAQDALGMPSSVVLPAALKANYQKEQAKHVTNPQPTDISSLEVAARSGEVAGNPLLIVDEAHRLRSIGSKGTQALKKNIASKRLLLTGSPFYNHPSDISALVNLASGESTLPESREGFIDKYIADERIKPSFLDKYINHLKPGVVTHMDPGRRKELGQILGKWVDYHPNSQKDFPEVTREDVDVEMTPKQLQVYDTVLGKAPWWVAMKIKRGLPPNKQEAKMLNAFMGDARQASNSTRAFEQQGASHEEPKIQRAFEELQKTLNSNPRAKAVVYSNWLNSGINPYKERLQAAGIPFGEFTGGMGKKQRDDMVKQYNANKLRALLLSSAGGEGLDLKGTRLLQMLDPHWNNEKLKQVEGRGVRYKSHAELPEDERNIKIQRFFATRPRSGIFERLGFGTPDMAADRYLEQMAANKARLNDEFRELLIESSGGG